MHTRLPAHIIVILGSALWLTVAYIVTNEPPFCNDCRRCTHIVTTRGDSIILNSSHFNNNSNPKSRWYLKDGDNDHDLCNMKLGTKTQNVSGFNFDCRNSSLIIRNLTRNRYPYEHHIFSNQGQDSFYFNITVISPHVNISGLNLLDKCDNRRCTTKVKYPTECNTRPPPRRTTLSKPHPNKHTTKHQPPKTSTKGTSSPNVPNVIDGASNYTVLGHFVSDTFQAEHMAWGAALIIILIILIWAIRYWLRKSKKPRKEYL
ncbi:Ja26 [Japanese cytomegalovirus]|nr:Ja26 [Japanese cytomegalovirus]